MSRFRLRYQATDLELPMGEFVIGRSSECSLALDDALVSRRHVLLNVKARRVVVEDLGSRNGIAVNGKPVLGKQEVRHLDRIQVGSQELLILERPASDAAATLRFQSCPRCGQLNEPTSVRCSACGARLSQLDRATLAGERPTLEVREDRLEDGEEEQTSVGSSFHLLQSIADKALTMGRYDEAERMLAPVLRKVQREAHDSGELLGSTLRDATGFAVRLMDGPRATAWSKWLFELHTRLRIVLERDTIERLHGVLRPMKDPPVAALTAYLEALEEGRHTPAERFRIKQLESLLRVIRA